MCIHTYMIFSLLNLYVSSLGFLFFILTLFVLLTLYNYISVFKRMGKAALQIRFPVKKKTESSYELTLGKLAWLLNKKSKGPFLKEYKSLTIKSHWDAIFREKTLHVHNVLKTYVRALPIWLGRWRRDQ